ncbi:hypothetical protein CONPUDRAFT_86438 [Coniophora puteana RWD-64-598 SS2]|uniref:Swiss Army Knife RNA repair protein HAD domain-containing protein n=1 Tax=Coniophora puteana (strain RWD-64-598) TaxID=741705 RepID=A0A5M3N583_CONPW|nr:uncharacterized protein CONPUDRAFT_86438 [Coniophora puteana RWD-64-598 SS2]EIW86468.1 hypothetical protein CONPUDRAFT_86438 [Coniophora puteana RWD-64-598 SS2]
MFGEDTSSDSLSATLSPVEDAQTSVSSSQMSKLRDLVAPEDGPVIAVDLDDVLSQTNEVVSQWHNEAFGSKVTLDNFYYYYYWKNPYWGTPLETHTKVRDFYTTGRIFDAIPVPGAKEGVMALRNMGYRLVVVTARGNDWHTSSWAWVEKHFPGLFHSLICTGQFANSGPKQANGSVFTATKLSKADVCIDLGAKVLIDDSIENALSCARHKPMQESSQNTLGPPTVLLFGAYQWNSRISSQSTDEREDMAYDSRVERTGGTSFLDEDQAAAQLELDDVNFGKTRICRVKDWSAVVKWIRAESDAGRL